MGEREANALHGHVNPSLLIEISAPVSLALSVWTLTRVGQTLAKGLAGKEGMVVNGEGNNSPDARGMKFSTGL